MKFYLAPMEGITKYVYRNAYHKVFYPMDKYFTPFIPSGPDYHLKGREKKDVLPKNNQGLYIVPQILTNRAADFLGTVNKLKELGYQEVNLNLGCPSGTVVSKGKGAGFLAKPDELDLFLNDIFTATDIKISVKTRIGINDPEEFAKLLRIYNQYPIYELIIHPRIRQDFYKNKPNFEVFEAALEQSKNPVCYNGDVFTPEDYHTLIKRFNGVKTIMLGRGIIRNPGLLEEILELQSVTKERLKEFHNIIYQGYRELIPGDRNVLFKMKELWSYMLQLFPDQDKVGKKIKKSQKLDEYEFLVNNLLM